MTRRIVKFRNMKWRLSYEANEEGRTDLDAFGVLDEFRNLIEIEEGQPGTLNELQLCPYGNSNDILWVREEHYQYGYWTEKKGVKTKTGLQKWMFIPVTSEILYEAPESFRKGRHHKDSYTPAWHKRLARFMPKSASRIWLEVTDIRVERLQDISEEDAISEGVLYYDDDVLGRRYKDYLTAANGYGHPEHDYPTFGCAKNSFKSLWLKINGPNSWKANPFVWCVKFKVLSTTGKPELLNQVNSVPA